MSSNSCIIQFFLFFLKYAILFYYICNISTPEIYRYLHWCWRTIIIIGCLCWIPRKLICFYFHYLSSIKLCSWYLYNLILLYEIRPSLCVCVGVGRVRCSRILSGFFPYVFAITPLLGRTKQAITIKLVIKLESEISFFGPGVWFGLELGIILGVGARVS